MYKFSLSDVLNPIRLRDLLNKFISDTGTKIKVGFGLSESNGKLELGEYNDNIRGNVIETSDDKSLIIGRVEGRYNVKGFVKEKGAVRMLEGDSSVTIQDDKDAI